MSNVPKSRRKQHDFIASHKLKELRRDVTDIALHQFGYDKAKVEKRIQKFEQGLNIEPEQKAEIVEKMRAKNNKFYEKFIDRETDIILDLAMNATSEFEKGNSVFPSGTAKYMEFCDRRKHLNETIGWLGCLRQELIYIAETLPGDKNRYEHIAQTIDEEIKLVKGVRRAANKYLKNK